MLKLKFWQTCGIILNCWNSVIYKIQIWFGLVHFKPKKKKKSILIFSRKIVTSPAHIFTMEKALFKIIFWHKIFICEPIFKIFVSLFMTFGMQMGNTSYFAVGISEK